MPILTDKTALAENPADGDLMHVVDVSDKTGSTAGTSKKVNMTNLAPFKRTGNVVSIRTAGDVVDYIDLNTSYSGSSSEGRIHWNQTDGTLEAGMPGGNVNLQIGQEVLMLVANKTGSQINNGSVVYISGAQGSRPTATLAKSDSGSTCSVIGVATEDILDNQSGYVTTYGLVRNIDTSSFVAGDTLYLSESVAGGLRNSSPDFPNYAIKIGKCLFSNNESGIILVELLIEACNHVVINNLGILGEFKKHITTVNSATYDLLATDLILHVTYTTTGAVTSLTLPTAQVETGRTIEIKDGGLNASTNNITIDTEGSEKIDGEDTLILNGDGESVSLYCDGSNWFVY